MEADVKVERTGSTVRIAFPARVCGTDAEHLGDQIERRLERLSPDTVNFSGFLLDFGGTRFIDSPGLNLIFNLVRFAHRHDLTMQGKVTEPAVRLALQSVLLDRKLQLI